ncbi:MAG: MSCRAMM family protein, partial [Planctomycetota bacterium]
MSGSKMNLLREALAVVAAVLIISPSVAGQTKPTTCAGRVVDAEGDPVAGARVVLHRIAYDYEANTAESKIAEQVKTTNDGVFSFKVPVDIDGNANGYVVAEKEGLALGWAEWRMRDDQQQDIILGDPKQLSGRVVDAEGKPVPGANVGVWLIAVGEGQKQQELGRPVSEQLLTTPTDASGRFTLTNIPADATADFIVRKPGKATLRTFRSTGYANQKMTFAPGQADIELVLPAEARIRGTVVVADTGNPIAGVRLIVETQENRPLFGQEPVVSKDRGTFSFDALAAGNYVVQLVRSREEPADWVAEPAKVALDEGQTRTDVRIELSKGGSLIVTTAEAGTNKPLAGTSVSIRDEGNNRWLGAKSDKEGIAQIRLMPGGYQISGAYKQGYTSERRQEAVTIE